MYNMIHDQVYQKTYDYLKDAYGEEQAKAIATQQADSFMVDVQEDKGSGAQQAASTAGVDGRLYSRKRHCPLCLCTLQ